jgi:hypothetical protein
MQIDAKAYVKRFTSVPETFIDELFQMMSESTKQSDIVIDVDKVAKWLNMLKNNIVKTLKRSYIQDVDYTLNREANPTKRKYGSNNWITVRLSPACFKELAMRSNSKNSALIRTYMLQVEDAFISYRNQTLEGMRNDVKVLLNNQKPRETRTNSKPGYVYMFRAKDGVSLYNVSNSEVAVKLGWTGNMQFRKKVYNTGFADDIDILYQVQTDDMANVEACVKALCKAKQYRKRKEVYVIDVDIMKSVINHCASGAAAVKRVPGTHKHTGGYFAVFKQN